MSITTKIINIVTATFKIEVVFEVTDHPDDYTDYKNDIKAVNVKYLFFKGKCGSEEERKEHVREKGNMINTITKNTDKKVRTKSDYWIDDICLFVLAEPADGWGEHYTEYVKQVNLKPGNRENITISLPPKMKH